MDKVIGIVTFVILFVVVISFIGGSDSPNSTVTPDSTVTEEKPKPDRAEVKRNYAALATSRWKEIEASIPELDRIVCYKGDCGSGVVYFDFNTLPDDIDVLIRLNVATFSNFKREHLGVSHVSLIATLNGIEILSCDGSKGRFDGCKEL